ncbi:preprotein translocase subunit SecG [Spiribacter sp. 1M189]|uniref:Protein-export membrane protein SecG n=2 Tax=Spiribacter insolitus TaxID=3122417 RepID=A0ABV3T806_9GAMM
MYTIVLVIHLALALVLIGVVLLQHGKGADAGAAFGSGASSTVFGARGSASFLGRLTGVLGVGFFVTSLTLAIMAGTFNSGGSVVEQASQSSESVLDSAPAPAGEQDDASGSAAPAPAPE